MLAQGRLRTASLDRGAPSGLPHRAGGRFFRRLTRSPRAALVPCKEPRLKGAQRPEAAAMTLPDISMDENRRYLPRLPQGAE